MIAMPFFFPQLFSYSKSTNEFHNIELDIKFRRFVLGNSISIDNVPTQ